MAGILLKRVSISDVKAHTVDPIEAKTREQSQEIVDDVKNFGLEGFIRQSLRLRDLKDASDPYLVTKPELKAAFDALPESQQALLQRTAKRIKDFAVAQRNAIKEIEVPIPGGVAGHYVAPVETAGCYAPGGRYPLPSSVLMTAVTARAAGVKNVWVASPNPVPVTLGAAYVSDCDGLVCVGGAQAVAAFAYGTVPGIPACDVIVGPGNKWVTAAKAIVNGQCNIDMLAGPSECLVLADETADPKFVAADLLAQAEHDVDAVPILVAFSEEFVLNVETELVAQLKVLSTAPVATESIKKGFAVVVPDIETGIYVCDILAPEHLEVMTKDAMEVGKKLNNYGGLFVGPRSAEVFGDYGAGPNHVLPTGATARYTGGLSVFTFLRIRTWMRIDDATASQIVVEDSGDLADLEGLAGHAAAARARRI